MAELMGRELLVQRLYQILDTLTQDIQVEKKKHQQEIDALLKSLKSKEEEIAILKKQIKQQNTHENAQSVKKQKSAMAFSGIFSRKKSMHEKPSLQIHINNSMVKNEQKVIKGVDMINSIQNKKSRLQSSLKKSQISRSVSRNKSQDFSKIGGQKGKSESIDKKCYVIKKKIDIQDKQNAVPDNSKTSLSYKSPSNKFNMGLSVNKKDALIMRDSKQAQQLQSSCKKKEETINKSHSRRQISVFVPLKRSKEVQVKKSIDLKE